MLSSLRPQRKTWKKSVKTFIYIWCPLLWLRSRMFPKGFGCSEVGVLEGDFIMGVLYSWVLNVMLEVSLVIRGGIKKGASPTMAPLSSLCFQTSRTGAAHRFFIKACRTWTETSGTVTQNKHLFFKLQILGIASQRWGKWLSLDFLDEWKIVLLRKTRVVHEGSTSKRLIRTWNTQWEERERMTTKVK